MQTVLYSRRCRLIFRAVFHIARCQTVCTRCMQEITVSDNMSTESANTTQGFYWRMIFLWLTGTKERCGGERRETTTAERDGEGREGERWWDGKTIKFPLRHQRWAIRSELDYLTLNRTGQGFKCLHAYVSAEQEASSIMLHWRLGAFC